MKLSLINRALNKLKGIPNVYIEDVKFLIAQHVPNNPVVLEAGACDGRDTLQMAVLWPKGQIHAFEPIPFLLEKTKKYVEVVKNVNFYPYALSNKNGTLQINVSSGESEGSSSILEPKIHLELHPAVLFSRSITVESITIDGWATKYKISNVDMLWLDLQGAELLALNGGEKTLAQVKAIFTEVNLVENYSGAVLYKDLKVWLESRGFYVAKEFIDFEDGGNVLFLRK